MEGLRWEGEGLSFMEASHPDFPISVEGGDAAQVVAALGVPELDEIATFHGSIIPFSGFLRST